MKILKVDVDKELELVLVDMLKREHKKPAYLAKQVRFTSCAFIIGFSAKHVSSCCVYIWKLSFSDHCLELG